MLRVLLKDMRTGKVKLRIDTLDDLWYLHGIIDEGDVVQSVTFRREEEAADAKREKRPEKRRVFLSIRVERMSFHEFSDRLRILGAIVEGDLGLGEHHTFNLTTGDEIAIIKAAWHDHHFERLNEAVEASKAPSVIIVAMDDEGALITELRAQGIREAATILSHASGKQFDDKARDSRAAEFFGQVLAKVTMLSDDAGGVDVVVCGPGFTREAFMRFASDRRSTIPMHSEGTSQAGKAGVNECIRSGVSKVIERSKVSEQAALVEKLMEGIAKGGGCAYGHSQVIEALKAGAVETLLVTDEVLRTDLMKQLSDLARSSRARVTIVATSHDAGSRLKGLGGVAALLRYKMG